jgi:hypothetical protein
MQAGTQIRSQYGLDPVEDHDNQCGRRDLLRDAQILLDDTTVAILILASPRRWQAD